MTASAATRYHLPEPLPAGEQVIWQGKPESRALALHAFHARKIAIYFGILAVWRVTSAFVDGDAATSAAISTLWLLLLGCAAVGVLMLMAWLTSRATTYTITSRRLLIQFGVALPMTLNIPFRVIGTAALRTYADGTGDIPVSITGGDRIAYLVLWPHVRPWRAARAEPMLRAVPAAKQVADLLAGALGAASPTPQAATSESFVDVTSGDAPPSTRHAAAAA
jgi:Bacterial PH domain